MIESDECGEEADVCEGDASVGDEIALLRQDLLDSLQRIEQFVERLLIRLLRRRKSAAIYTVVDVLVNILVDFVDLRLELGRVEVECRLLASRTLIIECAVQHLNDLR